MTLKDIAAALDLSIATVSMAMRNHREIAVKTRERVQAKAAELGYRPDAAMRALADYRTQQRSAGRRWDKIALLHDWPTEDAFHEHEFYGDWCNRLAVFAADRGIKIEEHWLGVKGANMRAVFRRLRHRGITGVMVAPPALTSEPSSLPLPRVGFQIVTFGPEHIYPKHHTVQFDYYENLRLAWSRLWAKGHRRIGLVYQELQGWRTGQAWRAAFHIEKLDAGCTPGKMMPLLVGSSDELKDKAAYLDWFCRDHYDAVISSVSEVEDWNRELPHPPDLAFLRVCRPGQQGIDLNVDQLLSSAIQLLYMEMQHSLIEQQNMPFRLHIPGQWVDKSRTDESL